jgi:TP901 family phage tail tape measure protein
MADLGTLKVPLVLQSSKFVTGMRSAQIAINQLEGKTKNLYRNLSNIGNALTMNVTVPLTIMGGAAVKAFSDFDLELRKISKTVEASDEFIRDLGGSFIELSQDIGVSRTSLSETAVAAGQLGVAAKNLEIYTKVATDMATVSTLTGEEALTGLQRITKLTGTAERDFKKVGDTIVEVGINLVTNEERIIDAATRLAATGRTVGLTAKQVIALSGAVTSVRDRVESGVTALDRVLSTMISATKEGGERLELFAHVANMTGQQFKKTFEDDAMSAIKQFIKGARDFEQRGGDIGAILKGLKISGVRTVQTVRSLASGYEILEDAIRLANKGWEENSALTRRAEKVYGSVTHQMKSLWETIKNTTALLGEAFQDSIKNMITILKRFLVIIQELVKQFAKLPPFVKSTIATFLTLVAVAGPLIAAAGLIGKAFAFIKVTLAAVSLSMGGVLGIIAAITVAIAGLTLALNRNKSALAEEQKSMNGLFENLKRVNVRSDERKRLINDINNIYGEYLDNTLEESDNWYEVYKAQKKANEELKRREKILAGEENLKDVLKDEYNNRQKILNITSRAEDAQIQLNEALKTYKKESGVDLFGKTNRQLSQIGVSPNNPYNDLLNTIVETSRRLTIFKNDLKWAFKSNEKYVEEIIEKIQNIGKSGAELLVSSVDKNTLKRIFKDIDLYKTFGEEIGRVIAKGLAPKIPIKPDFELDEKYLNITEKELRDYFDKNIISVQVIPKISGIKFLNDWDLGLRKTLNREWEEISQDIIPEPIEQKTEPNFDFEELKRAEKIFQNITDSLAQAVIYGQNFKEAMVNAIKAIAAQLAAKALLFGLLLPFVGGSGVSGLATILTGKKDAGFFDYLFGGFRANGGAVFAGTSYAVGEQGAEIFTPNVSGSITPHNDIIGTLEKGFGGIIESFKQGIPISGGIMKFNKDGLVEVVQDGTIERNARRRSAWGN